MDTNKKPAAGGDRQTGYDTTFDNHNHSPIRTRIKAVIVSLAIWGLIPPGLATWLLRHLRLEAE